MSCCIFFCWSSFNDEMSNDDDDANSVMTPIYPLGWFEEIIVLIETINELLYLFVFVSDTTMIEFSHDSDNSWKRQELDRLSYCSYLRTVAIYLSIAWRVSHSAVVSDSHQVTNCALNMRGWRVDWKEILSTGFCYYYFLIMYHYFIITIYHHSEIKGD